MTTITATFRRYTSNGSSDPVERALTVRSGQRVEVLDADGVPNPAIPDSGVYGIIFADGHSADAFADELSEWTEAQK